MSVNLLISVQVYTFSFERSTEVTEALPRKFKTAVKRRAVMCSSPATLKSFALKFIELMHSIDQIARTKQERSANSSWPFALPVFGDKKKLEEKEAKNVARGLGGGSRVERQVVEGKTSLVHHDLLR